MITRHPCSVLAVFAVSVFLGGMIGQFNDGPWGGLPKWLSTTSYAMSLISALVLIVLSVYLGIANLRSRRATQRG